MRQKTVAVLNCGVELKDTMYGIDIVSADRDFSVQIDRTEVTDLIAYLQAYEKFYLGKAEVSIGSATKAKDAETQPTIPVSEVEKRTAKSTVTPRNTEGLPPGGPVDPRFRVVDMVGQDLGKEVKTLTMSVQKRS